jgi:hypothetical protein
MKLSKKIKRIAQAMSEVSPETTTEAPSATMPATAPPTSPVEETVEQEALVPSVKDLELGDGIQIGKWGDFIRSTIIQLSKSMKIGPGEIKDLETAGRRIREIVKKYK